MATKIEWVKNPDGSPGETWNVSTGCTKVSEGCKFCFAERMSKRLKAMGVEKYRNDFKLTVHEDVLVAPLHWRKPRMIFVNSMSDLFHEDVPFEFIDKVFAVMERCSQHTFQVLTKRPERMAEYFARTESVFKSERRAAVAELAAKQDDQDTYDAWLTGCMANLPLSNVWLGTSCEDQATADERIPHLLKCPAAVRFLSLEPLLGAIDLDSEEASHAHALGCGHSGCECGDRGIDWVIVGGESGPGARPMDPDWVRSIRDQCEAAGVPYFFKQWGEWTPYLEGCGPLRSYCEAEFASAKVHVFGSGDNDDVAMVRIGKKKAGRILDGRTHDVMPEVGVAQRRQP